MRTKLVIFVFTVLVCSVTASAQITKAPPPPEKTELKLKLPDLGFMNEYFPGGANTLGISVTNGGEADARAFTVRIWVKKKGSTTKAYFESRVGGVKANGQGEAIFKNLPSLVDADIGIFIDSKKQVPESNEENCAMVFADGSAGAKPCKEIW